MTSTQFLELDFPTQLRQRTIWILLSLLLAWGFGLRLWYATPDLSSTRFWDERYGLENLEPLLKEGQLRPVHGFHPGFSYLPHGLILKSSDLLGRATGWQRLAIFDSRGRYTPTAYMICRTLSVLFGTATLLLVFLIGRRLGGDRLGLLAAFFLSVVPWHLRQSVLFKADITLLFTIVLTFYLSLRAVERPSVRSFVATGVAIGLALSSKFNAGPVAIPLTVGAFLRQGPKRRAFALLAGAAAVSVLVFLVLQPFVLIDPDIYRRSMGSTARIYEKVAARGDHGRLYLFWHLIETLHTRSFHGPVVGLLAVFGLTSLAALSIRRYRESRSALSWVMALSYVVAYTTLYALATPRPSPHNWLPVSPFAALGAAWAVLAGWLLLTRRLPERRWRPVGVMVVVILVIVLSWQATHYTYRETVPDTAQRALELLRGRIGKPDGRHVYTEYPFSLLFRERHHRGRLAIQAVDDLSAISHDALDSSDAEVFYAHRLDDPDSQNFYRHRLERLENRDVIEIEPELFHAWGPSLKVLIHPWMTGDEIAGTFLRSTEDPQLFQVALPAEAMGRGTVSAVFTVPRKAKLSEILLGGESLDSVLFRGPRRQMPRTTVRFEAGPELQLKMSQAGARDSFPFTLRTWQPPNLRPDRSQEEAAYSPTPIVVITIDTLRADRLGSYGYFRDTSPTLDRLAEEGILFEQAVTSMSLTLPAHTSLWTSLHPLQTGVLGNAQRYLIDPDTRSVRFFAEILQELGYTTCGVVSAQVLRAETGISIGFDTWDEPDTRYRGALETTDTALEWLQNSPEDPFFLWVHYFDPHSPYEPPPPFDRAFQTDAGLRSYLERNAFPHPTDPKVLESNNLYDGEILFLDSQIERLLNGLERVNAYADALIVVVGDHGEGLGQHDWFDHGRIFNEQLLVPLIIKLPERLGRSGERHSAIVSIVDLVPTLVEALELPILDADRGRFEGIDVLAGEPRAYAVSQRAPRPLGKHWDRGNRFSLISGEWKLQWGNRSTEALFHLGADPTETENLAAAYPLEADRLRAQLHELVRRYKQTRQKLAVTEDISSEAKKELEALGYLN